MSKMGQYYLALTEDDPDDLNNLSPGDTEELEEWLDKLEEDDGEE